MGRILRAGSSRPVRSFFQERPVLAQPTRSDSDRFLVHRSVRLASLIGGCPPFVGIDEVRSQHREGTIAIIRSHHPERAPIEYNGRSPRGSDPGRRSNLTPRRRRRAARRGRGRRYRGSRVRSAPRRRPLQHRPDGVAREIGRPGELVLRERNPDRLFVMRTCETATAEPQEHCGAVLSRIRRSAAIVWETSP
jgi:hypothetical protein